MNKVVGCIFFCNFLVQFHKHKFKNTTHGQGNRVQGLPVTYKWYKIPIT